MNQMSKEALSEMTNGLGQVYGCLLQYTTYEICEDLGSYVLDGEYYSGYKIYSGLGKCRQVYCFGNFDDVSDVPSEYEELGFGELSSETAHVRLLNRLNRLGWGNVPGGLAALPAPESPLEDYPEVDEDRCINKKLSRGITLSHDERMFLDDPLAWAIERGDPDGYLEQTDELNELACFLDPLSPLNGRVLHDGPLEKIAPLFGRPEKEQLLSREMLNSFDSFEGNDWATRCVMTFHRPLSIRFDFPDGQVLKFVRESGQDTVYGESRRCSGGHSTVEATHSCCLASYRVSTKMGVLGLVDYVDLVAVIAEMETSKHPKGG